MAPEQALGQLRDVGPHSDVYSLGAILYEMLAGVPPFRARTIAETLTLSTTEEARPPSQAGAGPLPRDLETICLKCLQKDPKKRYSTAGDFADDLRRFLDGEPIQARPVGRVERTLKWVRRRPASAALVGVCVLAAVSLLSLGFWYNGRLRAARDRAERRSQIAQAAVNDMYTQVAEKWLGDEPQMDDLQKEFLLKAAKVYEELADDEEQNPALRRETGQAMFRVGQIYLKLKHTHAAEQAFNRALAIQQDLLQQAPGSPQYRHDLANSYNWRGELFRTNSRPADALTSYEEALSLQQALVDEFTDKPAYRQELARSHYNRGLAFREIDRKGEALADFDRAVVLLESVVKQRPRAAEPQQELARVHFNRGTVLRRLGKLQEARTDYEVAIAGLARLRQEHARKPEYRHEQAVAYNNLANLRRENFRDPFGAEKDHAAARELLEALVKDFPSRPAYRKDLANVWNSLGAMFFQQGERWRGLGALLGPAWGGVGAPQVRRRRGEAMDAWRRAYELYRELARRWPQDGDYQAGAGQVSFNQGWLALQQGQADDARCALQAAILHEQAALRINPKSGSYRHELSKQYRTLARALRQLKDAPAAAEAEAAAARYQSPPN